MSEEIPKIFICEICKTICQTKEALIKHSKQDYHILKLKTHADKQKYCDSCHQHYYFDIITKKFEPHDDTFSHKWVQIVNLLGNHKVLANRLQLKQGPRNFVEAHQNYLGIDFVVKCVCHNTSSYICYLCGFSPYSVNTGTKEPSILSHIKSKEHVFNFLRVNTPKLLDEYEQLYKLEIEKQSKLEVLPSHMKSILVNIIRELRKSFPGHLLRRKTIRYFYINDDHPDFDVIDHILKLYEDYQTEEVRIEENLKNGQVVENEFAKLLAESLNKYLLHPRSNAEMFINRISNKKIEKSSFNGGVNDDIQTPKITSQNGEITILDDNVKTSLNIQSELSSFKDKVTHKKIVPGQVELQHKLDGNSKINVSLNINENDDGNEEKEEIIIISELPKIKVDNGEKLVKNSAAVVTTSEKAVSIISEKPLDHVTKKPPKSMNSRSLDLKLDKNSTIKEEPDENKIKKGSESRRGEKGRRDSSHSPRNRPRRSHRYTKGRYSPSPPIRSRRNRRSRFSPISPSRKKDSGIKEEDCAKSNLFITIKNDFKDNQKHLFVDIENQKMLNRVFEKIREFLPGMPQVDMMREDFTLKDTVTRLIDVLHNAMNTIFNAWRSNPSRMSDRLRLEVEADHDKLLNTLKKTIESDFMCKGYVANAELHKFLKRLLKMLNDLKRYERNQTSTFSKSKPLLEDPLRAINQFDLQADNFQGYNTNSFLGGGADNLYHRIPSPVTVRKDETFKFMDYQLDSLAKDVGVIVNETDAHFRSHRRDEVARKRSRARDSSHLDRSKRRRRRSGDRHRTRPSRDVSPRPGSKLEANTTRMHHANERDLSFDKLRNQIIDMQNMANNLGNFGSEPFGNDHWNKVGFIMEDKLRQLIHQQNSLLFYPSSDIGSPSTLSLAMTLQNDLNGLVTDQQNVTYLNQPGNENIKRLLQDALKAQVKILEKYQTNLDLYRQNIRNVKQQHPLISELSSYSNPSRDISSFRYEMPPQIYHVERQQHVTADPYSFNSTNLQDKQNSSMNFVYNPLIISKHLSSKSASSTTDTYNKFPYPKLEQLKPPTKFSNDNAKPSNESLEPEKTYRDHHALEREAPPHNIYLGKLNQPPPQRTMDSQGFNVLLGDRHHYNRQQTFYKGGEDEGGHHRGGGGREMAAMMEFEDKNGRRDNLNNGATSSHDFDSSMLRQQQHLGGAPNVIMNREMSDYSNTHSPNLLSKAAKLPSYYTSSGNELIEEKATIYDYKCGNENVGGLGETILSRFSRADVPSRQGGYSYAKSNVTGNFERYFK